MKKLIIISLLMCIATASHAQLDFRCDYYFQKRALHESIPSQKGAIVMLGNSLTERGYWSEYFPGKRLLNRGIGGDIIAGMVDRLESITKDQPSKIFVMAGINNLLFSDISPEQFGKEYTDLLTAIIKQTPRSRIYVQSMMPINEAKGGEGSSAFLKNKNPRIRQYNTIIKSIAESMKITFIDIYPLVEKQGELNPDYTIDGVHLSAHGYEAWVEGLRKHIK